MTGPPPLPPTSLAMPAGAAPLPSLPQQVAAAAAAERQGWPPSQPNWQVEVKVEGRPADLSSTALPPLVLPPVGGGAPLAGGTATPLLANNLAPGLLLPHLPDGGSGSPGAAASMLLPPLPAQGGNSAAPGAPPQAVRPAPGAGVSGGGAKRKAPPSAAVRRRAERDEDSDSEGSEVRARHGDGQGQCCNVAGGVWLAASVRRRCSRARGTHTHTQCACADMQLQGGAGGDLTQEDKAAEARRKNREAQQRFRERQRAAAREAEERYQAVSEWSRTGLDWMHWLVCGRGCQVRAARVCLNRASAFQTVIR